MGLGEDLSVRALFEMVLKGQGATQAAQQLATAARAADNTRQSFSRLDAVAHKTGSVLGGLLTRYLGPAAIAAAVTAAAASGTKAFSTLDRLMRAMRIQMEGLGIDAASAMPKVIGLLESLRATGGGVMSETLPALKKFLGLTKDLNASLALTKLASNMAESGAAGFGEAADLIASVMVGKASRSLKDFGVNMAEAADGSLDARAALIALIKQFPDAVGNIDDMQNALDRLGGLGEYLKENIGATVAQIMGREGVEIATATGQEIANAVAAGYGKAAEIAGRVQTIKDTEAAKKRAEEISQAEFETRQEGYAALADLAVDHSVEQINIQLAALKEAEERALATTKGGEQARQQIRATFAMVRIKMEQDWSRFHYEKQQEITANERNAAKERAAITRAEWDRQLQDLLSYQDALAGVYREQLRLGTDSFQQRADLTREIFRIEEAAALASAKTTEELEALRAGWLLKREAMERQLALDAVDMQLQTAGAIASIADSLFAENKAAAVAMTIINALESAVAVFKTASDQHAPYYVAALMAAAALAYGFAQVRRIEATEKQRSSEAFDDRRNDELAYHTSRKSVQDFVRLSGEGMRDELSSTAAAAREAFGMASRRPGVQITYNGPVFAGEAGMRQLRRSQEKAVRFDRARRFA